MIDYRELLKKYISMVGDCEGTTFIDDDIKGVWGFTEEEAQAMIDINKEVLDELTDARSSHG